MTFLGQKYRDEYGFNSIVVRLKEEGEKLSQLFEELFQFHSGSIKSFLVIAFAVMCYVGFNSIVVRLKGPMNSMAGL